MSSSAERARRWREENPGGAKAYREIHAEQIRLANAAYRETHREERRVANRERYAANLEELRAYHRAHKRTPAGLASLRKGAAVEFSRRPERAGARRAVRTALRRGALIKEPCEICGAIGRIEGHHAFGYEDPYVLAVWWLCPTDHHGMHQVINDGPVSLVEQVS